MIFLYLLFALILATFFMVLSKSYITLHTLWMAVIGFVVFFTVTALFMKVENGFIPLPIGVRHLYHRIFAPKDLYYPIVSDNFLFYEKGFSKTYLLIPKYFDFYDFGFLIGKEGLSSKYKFNGEIQLEFFWKDKALLKKVVTSIDTVWYIEGDMTKYKKVSLMRFEIPLLGEYIDDIKVKITVLEPDQKLSKYGDSIKLYIAVSTTP